MKLVRADPESPDWSIITEIVDVLDEGGVIVYPTDTVYGIGCILEPQPVARVYSIKKRSSDMPLSVAFSSLEMVRHYTDLTAEQEEYIKKHVTEPYTFIVLKKNIPDYVTAGNPTVGVRIPASKICEKIINTIGQPITTTSANISGRPTPAGIEEASLDVLENVDLVVDAGPCRTGTPSTIIDLTKDGKILR
jgi:L-threonylcarbamoyladenylate synthase